ncbi:ImmA/IrrE family metallo-endopeptidase [Rossellomorea marisflavi]|uniref:ImmA/IrrE family metallo-endopeptidase n=1 Tax=Rossellomorea marisflavi TaxID=189381 RepID=UPI001C93049A
MMVLYEKLLNEVVNAGVSVFEVKMQGRIKGLYSDDVIWINEAIDTDSEKYSILAEEFGHYNTSVGNIIDQSKLINRKQEQRARTWAYEYTIPISKIVSAHKAHVKNKFELAEYLGVTEDFVERTIERYIEKYGDYVSYKNFTVCLNPLGVLEWFDFSH